MATLTGKKVKDTYKSLLKLDAMLEGEVSLASYTSTEFYKSKDIYLNQVLLD